jgi:hypothetical protein
MTLPSSFLDAIGRPVDQDEASGEHTASVGDTRFRLRRDCHGVLRRLEISFAEGAGPRLEALAEWTEIVPGGLSVADLPGLGRLNLQPGRLDVALRLQPDADRLAGLLSLFVSPGGAARGSPP